MKIADNKVFERKYLVVTDASELKKWRISLVVMAFVLIFISSIILTVSMYPNIYNYDFLFRIIFIILFSLGVIMLMKIIRYPAYTGYILLTDKYVLFNTAHFLRVIIQQRKKLPYMDLDRFDYQVTDQRICFYPKRQQPRSNWWDTQLQVAGLPEKDIHEIIELLRKNIVSNLNSSEKD